MSVLLALAILGLAAFGGNLGGSGTGTVAAVGIGRDAESPPAAGRAQRPDRPFVPGEIVVRYRPSSTPQTRGALRREARVDVVRPLRVPRTELVRVGAGASMDAVLARLRRSAAVEVAEPNFVFSTQAVPNDPYMNNLWGLHNTGQSVAGTAGAADADIDAPEAWDLTQGDRSIVVAVVDTGVATNHPDLAPNLWSNPRDTANGRDDDGNGFVDDVVGWDFVDDDAEPLDFNGHGTHVAGTVGAAGNDGTGVAGVAWKVSIMALRALDADGSGTTADIADSFWYAGRNGARIVNASLGSSFFSQTILNSITAFPNTLFAVAAGNGGSDGIGDNNDVTPTYPCSYTSPNIVCVAATNSRDALTSFSNTGATSVDLAAPGSRILSDVPVLGPNRRFDDFETDLPGRWTVGGSGTTWGRTSAAAATGSFSLADSPSDGYANNTDSWAATAGLIDLSAARGCRLRYDVRMALAADGDTLQVQGSASESGPWTTLDTLTGSTSKFVSETTGLSRFDGAPSVFVRFRLVTNSSGTGDGVLLDNFSVACLGTPTGNSLTYLDGTSMATPHVAGAAALLWARTPSASLETVRTALLTGVDKLASLTGKTATGGRLNVHSALAASGPSPEPSPSPSPTASSSGEGQDTDPPPAPAIGKPLPSAVFAKSSVQVTGTAEPSSTVSVHDGASVLGETTADSQGRWAVALVLADGTHTVTARATDGIGNVGPSSEPRTFTVDTIAPVNPRVTGSAFGQPFRLGPRIGFGWRADDTGSGIASYDARVRVARATGGFGSFSTFATRTTQVSATRTLRPGTTSCFSIAARDQADNRSGFGPEACIAAPVNDRELISSGSWREGSASGSYLGTRSRSSLRGDTLMLRDMRARQVAIVATTCARCGVIDVLLGGSRLARLDLSSNKTRIRQVLAVANRDIPLNGTIKIRVVSRGKPVIIEGLGLSLV